MTRSSRRIARDDLRKVVVIASRYKPAAQDVGQAVVTWLEKAGLEVVPDIDGDGDLRDAATDADLAISVGGDGTMLSTARRLGPSQVPTLGINLGKLGFLAEFTEADIRDWIAGRRDMDLRVQARMRLRCHLLGGRGRENVHYALNDAAVHQGVLTRLATLTMAVDGRHATTYRADGVVISTPVGSTAYSLSLGGPILTPGLKACIVTPIAPHALTNRAVVISGQSKVRFRLDSPVEEAALVIDGHEKLPLVEGSEFEISRARKDFLVVTPAERSYYDLLRSKLGWGEAPRLSREGEV